MDSALRFGKIHIIEWLAAGDAKTGWELFEELQPMGLTSTPQVDVGFVRVLSKAELVARIRAIGEEFRTSGALPLLHVEAHGFQDGICARAGDEILWPELMQELIPLNEQTRLRLCVVVAACEGAWGLKMAQPATRAAFLALLGPNRQICAGDLSRACQVFYRGIFQHRNGNTAFKAMNDAIDPAQPSFSIVNAEMLFTDVYRAFLKERCTEEELAARVERLVAAHAEKFRALHGVGMWAHEVDEVRALARAHLHDHEDNFEHHRRQFFFVDRFPENDERFPVTLADCREPAGD